MKNHNLKTIRSFVQAALSGVAVGFLLCGNSFCRTRVVVLSHDDDPG